MSDTHRIESLSGDTIENLRRIRILADEAFIMDFDPGNRRGLDLMDAQLGAVVALSDAALKASREIHEIAAVLSSEARKRDQAPGDGEER